MSMVAPISVIHRLRTMIRNSVAPSELAVLRWLVPLALLHGLIYMLLAPPWQHYDEPGHFLYAAEIAAGDLDTPGAASTALLPVIADSMYRFRFYPPDVLPSLDNPSRTDLGFDQRLHPPLYYTLTAVPLRLLGDQPIETQLFAARAVGLALYVLTVIVAWRIAVALVPDEPLMQLVIPLLVLLSPAFTDIMTAVNNDTLLNFSLTIATLGAVLLIRDGIRTLPLALIGVGILVAFFTKRTALVMVVPLGFAAIWAVLRRPMRWWVMPLIGVTVTLSVGVATLQPVVVPGPPAEHTVLSLRPWFRAFDEHYLRLYADLTVRSLTDPTLIGDRYTTLIAVAFGGYYAHFAWGQVTMPLLWIWTLAVMALVAMGGLVIGGLKTSEDLELWQRRSLWLFLVAVVVAWISLFVRLHPLPPLEVPVYIPRARYMFWTIVPTLWLLALGLSWATPTRWRRFMPLALLGFFVCLDGAAWLWKLSEHFYR